MYISRDWKKGNFRLKSKANEVRKREKNGRWNSVDNSRLIRSRSQNSHLSFIKNNNLGTHVSPVRLHKTMILLRIARSQSGLDAFYHCSDNDRNPPFNSPFLPISHCKVKFSSPAKKKKIKIFSNSWAINCHEFLFKIDSIETVP